MEGDVASRELLLSSASPRTWWLAVAADYETHVLTTTTGRPTSMLGIDAPESRYSRQAGGTVVGDRASLSQA